MIRLTYYAFVLFAVFLAVSCGEPDDKLQLEVDSITKKWVPDKREAIFNVTLTKPGSRHVILAGETNLEDAKKDLLSYFKEKDYLITDSISLLPDSSVGNQKWALVNISVAQLRYKPDNASELVSQATLGTPVKVLKRNRYWVLVQTPDNYIAWIKQLSLSFLSESDFSHWKHSKRVIYTSNYGELLDADNQIFSDIVEGCILQKISNNNARTKVIHPKGDTVFVYNTDIRDFDEWKNDTIYKIQELINKAKELRGIPYLWGGTSVKAMDCSGFIKTIYFSKGIILSRDASQQVLYGDSVSLADNYSHLQNGDLLFFTTSEKSKRITHVAMYIGNNEYIQAAGRVKINSLDSTKSNFSAFRIPTLKLAKRYKGQKSQKGICKVKNHEWY